MRLTAGHCLLAAGLAVLAACAEVPVEMRYYPGAAGGDSERLWPALPEVPRYRFAGELTGEDNFGPAERSELGAGEKFLRWIVGLAPGHRQQPRILVRPQSGIVDRNGRILVTDNGRSAVFVFDVSQGSLSIWDQADRRESFSDPIGIVQQPNGDYLVADAGLQRVVRLQEDGQVLGSFGEGILQRPTGMAFDAVSDRLFVADTRAHDIKVFDANGILTGLIGMRGSAPGEFNAPTHLSLADGRLYVTDTLNARLQVLDLEGEPVTVIGKRGLYVGNFIRPKGVTVDADGNIYVVESYYDHLLVFDRDGRFLLPIGGTGTGTGQFYLPAGAWNDDHGHIYIADMYNGRVMIFQYLGG